MNLVAISVLGASGGALVQVVEFCAKLTAWQRARHDALASRGRCEPPPLSDIVDPLADTLVLLTRLVLGAAAGLLFHAQVSGATAAVAIGAAAPALLRQFGELRPAVSQDKMAEPYGTGSGLSASIKGSSSPGSMPEAAE
jgi:hypothetical protein